MDQKLFSKYGQLNLPRYTSYPTAPNFAAASGSKLHEEWLSTLPPDEPVSLYLHVPFCRSMCWYCGCHTRVTKQDKPINSYLEALKSEIALVAQHIGFMAKFGHVHFGGGTPTIMLAEQFLELTGALKSNFAPGENFEMAVEIDPRTLNPDMISAMAKGSVNRASLGVQSFDPDVQRAINRIQSEDQTAIAVTKLRAAGISAINFDLIYGLPRQTLASCIDTAKRAANLRPDRISVFGYAHVPAFKKHQGMIAEDTLPDELERFRQAEAIADQLTIAGYVRIGLDHFALPEDGLALAFAEGSLHRNFQGYTSDPCATLIGLGASSISRFGQGYIQNDVSIRGYQRGINKGELASARECLLTEEDCMRGLIIERLMCDFAVNLDEICTGFGRNFKNLVDGNSRLEKLESDGLLIMRDGFLQVQSDARFVVRAVAAAFDANIEASGRKFSKAA